MSDKLILNAEEVAELLGYSIHTVRLLAREGKLPARKIGREWRFSRDALLKWIEVAPSQQKNKDPE